jgi:hypothetical protein
MNLLREIPMIERGPLTIRLDPDTELDAILPVLDAPGAMLKKSRKSTARRVHGLVIKEIRARDPWQWLRQKRLRGRLIESFDVARYLLHRDVLTPIPRAVATWRYSGMIWRAAVVSDYLHGHENVEVHGRRVPRHQAPAFLAALAGAVNRLTTAGAYHADLSGKNIFTADGRQFVFIDIDAVQLHVSYSDPRRLKNHVQLYDSFCDWWGPDILDPFLAQLEPGPVDAAWLNQVHARQAERRARIEALWRREGSRQ